jgi:hypothetical protein
MPRPKKRNMRISISKRKQCELCPTFVAKNARFLCRWHQHKEDEEEEDENANTAVQVKDKSTLLCQVQG